jgi:AraC family ethanolamine operon transcriptional activator
MMGPLAVRHSATSAPRSAAEGFHAEFATDVNEHAANLDGWRQIYDQLSPGKFRGSIGELWIGKLQIFRETTSHKVRQSCNPWQNSWWFGIPSSADQGQSKLGNKYIDADAIAVRAGNTDFELLTPDDFEILGIVIEQEELAEYLRATEQLSDLPSFPEDMLRVGQRRRTHLQTLLEQILTEVTYTPHLLMHAGARQAMKASVLEALADTCQVQIRPSRLSSTTISHHSLVSQIRDYILSRRDETVTVADLCRSFYVNRRTLQNAFHNAVGMSPVAYLRAIRLNGLRRTLRNSTSPVVTVQDAAAEWGFWHLSQLASDYKRMFGELPSESLRQRIEP